MCVALLLFRRFAPAHLKFDMCSCIPRAEAEKSFGTEIELYQAVPKNTGRVKKETTATTNQPEVVEAVAIVPHGTKTIDVN